MTEPRRDDTTRLEGFSDAIFGFAATLLVVSLEVPKDFASLTANLKGFVAFGLSFGVLAGLWMIHRTFFRRYQVADLTIVVLNTILLFVVLFYVYPLKFLAKAFVARFLGVSYAGDIASISVNDLAQMFAIYGAGWAAVFVCFALMYSHAWRRRAAIGLSTADAQTARDYFGHYLVFAAVGAISTAVALANAGIAYGLPGLMYFLMGPALTVYWRWRMKTRAPAAVVAERAAL
jgi:uncharacterized membrane protein